MPACSLPNAPPLLAGMASMLLGTLSYRCSTPLNLLDFTWHINYFKSFYKAKTFLSREDFKSFYFVEPLSLLLNITHMLSLVLKT